MKRARIITSESHDLQSEQQAELMIFGTPKERLDFYRREIQYETSLLAFYEQVTTLNIMDELQHLSDPRDRLRALIAMTTAYDPAAEVALRAWARQDEKAAALQRKLDQTREQYVADLVMQIVPDPEKAKQLAKGYYWMFVGSQQAFMEHDPQQKKQIHVLMLDQLGL